MVRPPRGPRRRARRCLGDRRPVRSVPADLLPGGPRTEVVEEPGAPDLQVSGGRHVDQALRVERIEATVARLVALGATEQARLLDESEGDRLDHVVLLDPEGNELCVV